MNLTLSPSERIVSKDGKIIDYFCIEESGKQCRAKADGTQITRSFSGEVPDGKRPLRYATKMYGLKEGDQQIPSESIGFIDGKAVKFSFQDDHFTISKGR